MPSDGLNVAGDGPAPADKDTSFLDIMNFDFSPTPSEPPAGGEAAERSSVRPPEGSDGQQGDATIPPGGARPADGQQPTPQSAGESQPPAQTDKVQETLAAIAAMLAEDRQARAAPAPKGPATPAPPKFNFTVPTEIQSLVMSEDASERDRGFAALVTGVANAVWNEVLTHTQGLEQRLATSVPQTIQQHMSVEQQQAKMREVFFGEYPDLGKTEMLQDLVANVAQKMILNNARQGIRFVWDEKFRDELAGNVYRGFGAQAPTAKRGAPALPAPAPKTPRQPFVAGRGARPANGSTAPSSEVQDIWETLGIVPFS